jgi:hypothetical protein
MYVHLLFEVFIVLQVIYTKFAETFVICYDIPFSHISLRWLINRNTTEYLPESYYVSISMPNNIQNFGMLHERQFELFLF